VSPFDPKEHGLQEGWSIDNSHLREIFRCSQQGGIRRSHATNSLILISDQTGIHNDRWVGDTLYYTGMGRRGDQQLRFQNKTLAESRTNGVDVYLFEVRDHRRYTFQGLVELIDAPRTETQPDADDNPRMVYVFPLRRVSGGGPTPVSDDWLERQAKKARREASRLSDEELETRARTAEGMAGSRQVTSSRHVRNENVSLLARRRAAGVCQLCEKQAPFKGKDGEPYLETHHIIWLARDGDDTVDNAVALCPNCHRKMHVLDRKSDIRKLKSAVRKFSIEEDQATWKTGDVVRETPSERDED
jgi:5-methylcytosine-specific restriction protein A